MTAETDESFECPQCGVDLIKGVASCPGCGEVMDWSDLEETPPDETPLEATPFEATPFEETPPPSVDSSKDLYECPACKADLSVGMPICPKCGGELDWTEQKRGGADEELQSSVNALLRRGIFFSIFWLAGIGSVYSLVLAKRAKRMIDQSEGRLKGNGRVWWCYILGGAGIGIMALVCLNMIVRALV